jgi:hypothetical protein
MLVIFFLCSFSIEFTIIKRLREEFRDLRRVNHFSKKGCLSELEDYLTELKGKPKIRLGNRDKQILYALIYKPEYLASLNKYINELYEGIPLDKNTKKRINGKHAPHHSITGPMREQTTGKAIGKLRKYKLIKSINKSLSDKGLLEGLDDVNLTRKEFFAANIKRAKLFDITEYGLFCFLSQAQLLDFEPSVLGRRWESKTVKLLLSPYFEKESVAGRLTTLQFSVIRDFLQGALHIVNQRLSMIENQTESDIYIFEELNKNKKVKKYTTRREEMISKLEDDLEWHAKSFALRLMVDTASEDKDKSEQSRSILRFLAHDEKFVKLVKDTMHEILSYYDGDKLLEFDKTLHP